MNISMTCEYCDDNSHLTIECPGLRHGNPIARAYIDKRFGGQCSRCSQLSHPGRKMFALRGAIVCGDCAAGGTSLVAPKVEPLTAADCCAWETPCDEGVG